MMQPQEPLIQNDFVSVSKSIVKKFLQSVVVIDDKATFGERSEPIEVVIAPNSRGRRGNSVTNNSSDGPIPSSSKQTADSEQSNDSEILNVKSLNDCFADIGLVCSVLRPTEEETASLSEKTDHVAGRADIIVFDWLLSRAEDPGTTALKSILAILKKDTTQSISSTSQSRTRLIAIYTSEPALNQIVETTKVFLKAEGMDFTKKDKFTLLKEGAKIVFYKKNRGVKPSSTIFKSRTVNESELTTRLVDDFTSMTQGLLSNMALASLGALRDNTYRILGKFDRSLDAPYITHRALIAPEEAQQHPVPLLTAEFNDVLEDCSIDEYASIEMIKNWIDFQIDNSNINLTNKVENFNANQLKDALLSLVENGLASELKKTTLAPKWKSFLSKIEKKDEKSVITGLLTNDKVASDRDLSFAALTTLRSQYEKPIPKLTLGTIIEVTESHKKNYYICIQPVCDSVRLAKDTVFPFLKLQDACEPENGSIKNKFNIVVYEKGKYKKFRIKLKYSDSKLFTLLYQPSGEIRAQQNSKGEYFFNAKGRPSRLRWVADLKFAHAQRIANDFAHEISRVGLMESDWLRRMAK